MGPPPVRMSVGPECGSPPEKPMGVLRYCRQQQGSNCLTVPQSLFFHSDHCATVKADIRKNRHSNFLLENPISHIGSCQRTLRTFGVLRLKLQKDLLLTAIFKLRPWVFPGGCRHQTPRSGGQAGTLFYGALFYLFSIFGFDDFSVWGLRALGGIPSFQLWSSISNGVIVVVDQNTKKCIEWCSQNTKRLKFRALYEDIVIYDIMTL